MKTLKLTFRSGSHSTRTMQLKYVAEELDEATIKQAMQEIGEFFTPELNEMPDKSCCTMSCQVYSSNINFN